MLNSSTYKPRRGGTRNVCASSGQAATAGRYPYGRIVHLALSMPTCAMAQDFWDRFNHLEAK